jgi:ubiquinone/menaquinone biosynthesis C-methylase UbiE
MTRRAAPPELMDDLTRSEGELRETLLDLGRINRYFGGHAIVRAYLDRLLPVWQTRTPVHPALTVLDVATGGADIPVIVAGWAARRRVPVRIVAVDRHPTIVHLARELTVHSPAIAVLCADARALPFRDGSFDVCLCSLALHHLTPEEGLGLLRDLHRLARIGFLVVDLLRSPSGYAGVWLATRFSQSPLIRHDGPVSVRRSRSWREYQHLAEATGIPGIRVTRHPFFRVALARIG